MNQELGSRNHYRLRAASVAFLLIATVGVLFLRRPDQFLAPYIWVEDGRYILREYFDQGWGTLLNPLSGYLLTATKIISYVSFKASILYAPQIETTLTVALTFGAVIAVAFSPTYLRYPVLCAVAILLIPTDAENFGVSSYAFWWAGILYLLAIIWDVDRGKDWLRYAFILFGGLSSPLAVSLGGLFVVRAAVERRGWTAALLAIVVAGLQIAAMKQQRLDPNISAINVQAVLDALSQFVGNFVINGAGLAGGLVMLAIYGGAVLLYRKRFGWPFWLLVIVNAIVCGSIALRMAPGALGFMDPFTVAPRYFFYPFILLGWLLIWIAAQTNRAIGAITLCVFAVSIASAGGKMSRRHDHISWHDEILKCAQSDAAKIPVHYIGSAKDTWFADFTGRECQEMIRRSLF